jgi:hypothetical protein
VSIKSSLRYCILRGAGHWNNLVVGHVSKYYSGRTYVP